MSHPKKGKKLMEMERIHPEWVDRVAKEHSGEVDVGTWFSDMQELLYC